MKSMLPVLAILALSAPAWAADDFATQVLAAHNSERAALNVPPLTWNAALAADAAVWAKHLADTGSWAHADAATRKGEGENLWEGTAGAFTPTEMVGGWIGEKRYYHYGPFPNGGLNDGLPIGHYTQMIWRDTTEIGCALATGHGKDVLVCRYAPMGNAMGQKPY
jgi:uncharacterized protein YkwD